MALQMAAPVNNGVMLQEVYQQMLWAVEVSQSPTATEQGRAQAFQALTAFPQHPDCSDYAFYVLLNPTFPEHTNGARHFALLSLHKVITSSWGRLTGEKRERYQKAMLELVNLNPGVPLLQEAAYVREKVASLVAEVVKGVLGPKNLTFLRSLLEAWPKGPRQAELVMLAITVLVQDSMDMDFNTSMPAKQRTAILQGLKAIQDTFMGSVYGQMVYWYQTYQAVGADGTEVVTLLSRALNMLHMFMPWFEVVYLGPPPQTRPLQASQMSAEAMREAKEMNKFLRLFEYLAQEPRLRMDAYACLAGMAKSPPAQLNWADYAAMMERLPQLITTTMQALSHEVQQKGNDAAAFLEYAPLLLLMCEALEGLTKNNLAQLVTNREYQQEGTLEAQALGGYLQQTLGLLRTNSLRVTEAALTVLLGIYREPWFYELPLFLQLGPHVLEEMYPKITKVAFDESGGTEDLIVDREFIDRDEYREVFLNIRNKFIMVLEKMVPMQPYAVVEFMANTVQAVLPGCRDNTDWLDRDGLPTKRSRAWRQAEVLTWLIDKIVPKLPQWVVGPPEEDPERMEKEANTRQQLSDHCGSRLASMTELILAWDPTTPLLLSLKLQMLVHFKPFLRYDRNLLVQTLSSFFDTSEYEDRATLALGAGMGSDGMPQQPTLSKEGLELRRTATACCISVALAMPEQLVVAMDALCRKVRELIERGKLLDIQVTHYYEMLVTVSNVVPDMTRRRQFVQDIMQVTMELWRSPTVTAMVQSPQSLLESFGMLGVFAGGAPGTANYIENALIVHQKVQRALETMLSVSKRIKVEEDLNKLNPAEAAGLTPEDLAMLNPFLQLWPHILPNLLGLIKSLHLIWEPHTRDRLLAHPDARYALMELDEGRGKKQDPPPQDVVDRTPLAQRWGKWLTVMRTTAYQLLASCCRHRVFYLYYQGPQVAPVLNGGVLAGLQYMDHNHVLRLLKDLVPVYTLACPVALYPTHLTPLLAPLCQHLLHRLSVAWTPPLAAEVPPQDQALHHLYTTGHAFLPAMLAGEARDIAVDNARVNLTRTYMETIQAMLALKGELSKTREALNGWEGLVSMASDDPASADPVKERGQALTKFLLDTDQIAYPVVMFVLGALCWRDQYTLQRALSVLQLVTELKWRDPKYSRILGTDMFGALVMGIVTEPKWLVGKEQLIISQIHNLYVRLVMGINPHAPPEEALTPVSELPRLVLLQLPGGTTQAIAEMETMLFKNRKIVDQKDAIKEVLREAASQYRKDRGTLLPGDTASPEESMLHTIPNRIRGNASKLQQRNQRGSSFAIKAEAEADVEGIASLFDLW